MNHVNDVNGTAATSATAVSDQQKRGCGFVTTIRESQIAREKTELKLHGCNTAQGAHVCQVPWGSHNAYSNDVVGQRKHLQSIARRNDKHILTHGNTGAVSSAVCVTLTKLWRDADGLVIATEATVARLSRDT